MARKKLFPPDTIAVPESYEISDWTDTYNSDRLQLMTVGASHMFAYWSLSNRKKWLVAQHFQCDWSVMPKIIRVYNTTDLFFDGTNANHFFDIHVAEAISWHIHHLNPDSTYVADFGTLNLSGQFVPIIRSHAVKTPRNTIVAHGAPIVSPVTEVQQGVTSAQIRSAFFENFASITNYSAKGSV